MAVSEDRVRAIVREELTAFLHALGKKAEVPDYLVTEKMEDTMTAIITTIAEKEAKDEVHAHEDYYDVH